MTVAHTFVIAEAGVNHNGSVERALELIEASVHAGADAVKFQTFKAEDVVSRYARKADYQARNTDERESQSEMVQKLELDLAAHERLVSRCRQRGIQFISTPFDLASVDMLVNSLGIERIKIGSGEITHAPLLLRVAESGVPVILSTGMSSLGEIEEALGVMACGYLHPGLAPSVAEFKLAYQSAQGQSLLEEKVVLLHCTTEYPAPLADVNLRAMDTMAAAFGLPVGLSDHTVGFSAAVAGVARGACVIEKHLTLDRSLPGPDHSASLEPDELAAMVRSIREVEEAIGSPRKLVAPSELKNLAIARKSLVALRAIRVGEPFSVANLGVKRPGMGISPMRYWELLGVPANRDYSIDEVILP